MQRYINSQRGAGCICDAIEIGELEDEVDEEVKVAFEIAIAEREAECLRQCPPIASKCTVARTDSMTDYEYESECTALSQEASDRAEEDSETLAEASEEDDDESFVENDGW